MKRLLKKYNYDTSDSEEIRISKYLIISIASFCCICGIIWGCIFYSAFGFGLTSSLPFLFVCLVLPGIIVSHYFSNYKILVHIQLICITLIPCLVQWSLGSIEDSGLILTWCFLSPLGALLFLNEKDAIFWMVVFIFIVCISAIFVPTFSEDAARITESFRLSLYLMNIIAPFMLIFITGRYFYNGLLVQRIKLEEKEELLKASAEIEKQKSLLSASKERLELVMGSLEEVVWGRNLPDYKMQYVSDSVLKLYGFPMADWYEKPNLWLDMIHPDDIKRVKKEGESLFTDGITLLEYRIITPDKEIKWISSTTKILKSTDGTPFLMTGIAQDITARKKIQEQLNNLNNSLEEKVKERTIELINSEEKLKKSLVKEKELGELKSSFIAVASHQFRTPLAIIQSNAELIEMLNKTGVKQEPEKYTTVTSRITTAISKMTELIDDVLTIGKLTSGKVSCNPKEIDLIDFCGKMVEEFNAVQLDGRNIDFVYSGDIYQPYLDSKLLEHSLSNLISNAFKYSVGNEKPELSINFKPKELVISIKDYGVGIPENERKHLFEPFFRAENVSEIQGTGLGLSIAKEYVEVNKGNIVVKSTLGKGSTFEITFPKERI